MMRRRLGAAAVKLYPPALRAGRGAELLGTALDAGDASRWAFAIQLLSLTRAGLGARCRAALGQSPRQIAADAVAWAAVISVAMPLLVFFVTQLQHGSVSGSLTTVLIGYLVPALVLGLFSTGRTQQAGVIGCAWALTHVWVGFGSTGIYFPPGVRFAVVPAAGFGLMALGRCDAPRSGRWLWIWPAATFALLSLGHPQGWLAQLNLEVTVLLGLLLLPLSPGFALGLALVWSYTGAWDLAFAGAAPWLAVALLSVAPLTLILTGSARRAARPR